MKLTHLLISLIVLAFSLSSCNDTGVEPKSNDEQIAQAADYEKYLSPDSNPAAELANENLDFWQKKLEAQPSQFPYRSKIAAAQSQLFEQTGDIAMLHGAYENLKEVNKSYDNKQAGALRSFAHNCISQHKFQEAYDALKIAEENKGELIETQKMLFDVCLELGKKDEAEKYLQLIESEPGFEYNIRLAKWMDHEGNLDSTITLMETALAEVEANKNEGLILWSVTNLGDYYGHAGRIKDSYNMYLKALSIDPNNSYALKGIAWIAYSHDKNIDEAKRILVALRKIKDIPDYDLRLAEIADYQGNEIEKKDYLASFLEKIKDPNYGDMYNAYEVGIVTEDMPNLARAMELGNIEVSNRPTAMSYSIQAWAYHKNNENEKALEIIEQHVAGKTTEPAAQYRMAAIYKANNLNERVQGLKADLEGSVYELGPVMGRKIGSL